MASKTTTARYQTISTIDLTERLRGTKAAEIWKGKEPLRLRILATSGAWRADWSDASGNELHRLLRVAGGAVYLMNVSRQTVQRLDEKRLRARLRPVEVLWREARDPKLGKIRHGTGHVPLGNDLTALASVTARAKGDSHPCAPFG
jgi:hypothetical protein